MFMVGVALLKADDPVAAPFYIAIGVVVLMTIALVQSIIKWLSRRMDARTARHRRIAH